jgi:hypothetical protein
LIKEEHFLDIDDYDAITVCLTDELRDFATDEAVGRRFRVRHEATALGRYASLLTTVLAISSNGLALLTN